LASHLLLFRKRSDRNLPMLVIRQRIEARPEWQAEL